MPVPASASTGIVAVYQHGSLTLSARATESAGPEPRRADSESAGKSASPGRARVAPARRPGGRRWRGQAMILSVGPDRPGDFESDRHGHGNSGLPAARQSHGALQ